MKGSPLTARHRQTLTLCFRAYRQSQQGPQAQAADASNVDYLLDVLFKDPREQQDEMARWVLAAHAANANELEAIDEMVEDRKKALRQTMTQLETIRGILNGGADA